MYVYRLRHIASVDCYAHALTELRVLPRGPITIQRKVGPPCIYRLLGAADIVTKTRLDFPSLEV